MIEEKKDTNINNLILSIQRTMNDFAEGNLSLHEATAKYQNLLDLYNEIESDKKKDEGANIIGGLCYYNNTENYSLLSGVYHINSDDIVPLTYYGDKNLNTKTMKTIRNNINSIKGSKLITIQPDDTMLHSVYIYPLFSDKNEKAILASVTSSTYFSKEKFTFEGKLFKELFSVSREDSHFLKLNYSDKVSEEIEKYVKENVDEEYYVQATLYVFTILEKIFNHLGITTLIKISDLFMDILKNKYKEDSKCLTLSIRDYIVLKRIRRNHKEKGKQKKLEFRYKDINIPYKILNIDLETKNSIYNLWEKILLFENYLTNGDIMK